MKRFSKMKKIAVFAGFVLGVSACQSYEYANFPEEESIDYEYVEENEAGNAVSEVYYIDENSEVQENFNNNIPVYEYGTAFKHRQEQDFEISIKPEDYAIVARRTINKMLDESADEYRNHKNGTPLIYIETPKLLHKSLPAGFYLADENARKIIENAKAFKPTDNKDEADYILETEIDVVTKRQYNNPVVEYHVILSDADGSAIDECVETIHQIDNDNKSWQ